MKPPKFRVWSAEDHKYLSYRDVSIFLDASEGLMMWGDHPYGGPMPYNMDCNSFIFELSTGISDSLGTEIYEGDILEVENIHGYKINCEIRYGEYSVQVDEFEGIGFYCIQNSVDKIYNGLYGSIIFRNRKVKIIGNIHDNPRNLS